MPRRITDALANGHRAPLRAERRFFMALRPVVRDGYEGTSIVAAAIVIKFGIFETSCIFVRTKCLRS